MFKNKYFKFLNQLPMILPMLLFGVIISSAITVLLPVETIQTLLGSETGFIGIFLSILLGIVLPNEPFLAFPIIASLSRSGVGVFSVIAILSSWSLFSISKYPLEIGILGPRLSIKRSLYALPILFIILVLAFIVLKWIGIN